MPARRRRATALHGLLRGEQGCVRGLPGDVAAGRGALDRRGVPRRPRARADLGLAAGDRRAAAARGARAGRAADHGRGGTDQVPRQGGQRRGEARRPARRAARRRAGVPPPAARRTGLGRRARSPRASSTPTGSRPSARSRESPRRRWSPCSDARREGSCMPSPTTATRGSCGSAAGGARWGRSERSGEGGARPRRSTPSSSAWSTVSPAGCAPRTGSAAPSCCGSASRTSRARRARTRWPRRRPRPRRSSPRRRDLLAAAMPLIESQGLTLVGDRARQPRRRRRGPARAAVRPQARRGARRGARRRA